MDIVSWIRKRDLVTAMYVSIWTGSCSLCIAPLSYKHTRLMDTWIWWYIVWGPACPRTARTPVNPPWSYSLRQSLRKELGFAGQSYNENHLYPFYCSKPHLLVHSRNFCWAIICTSRLIPKENRWSEFIYNGILPFCCLTSSTTMRYSLTPENKG